MKKIPTHATTWMNLKDMLLSQVSQTPQRQILYGSTYRRYLPTVVQFVETETGTGVGTVQAGRRAGSYCLTGTAFPF